MQPRLSKDLYDPELLDLYGYLHDMLTTGSGMHTPPFNEISVMVDAPDQLHTDNNSGPSTLVTFGHGDPQEDR